MQQEREEEGEGSDDCCCAGLLLLYAYLGVSVFLRVNIPVTRVRNACLQVKAPPALSCGVSTGASQAMVSSLCTSLTIRDSLIAETLTGSRTYICFNQTCLHPHRYGRPLAHRVTLLDFDDHHQLRVEGLSSLCRSSGRIVALNVPLDVIYGHFLQGKELGPNMNEESLPVSVPVIRILQSHPSSCLSLSHWEVFVTCRMHELRLMGSPKAFGSNGTELSRCGI